jgi:hypothetical protein
VQAVGSLERLSAHRPMEAMVISMASNPAGQCRSNSYTNEGGVASVYGSHPATVSPHSCPLAGSHSTICGLGGGGHSPRALRRPPPAERSGSTPTRCPSPDCSAANSGHHPWAAPRPATRRACGDSA